MTVADPLAAAIRYARSGWPVFPCRPDGTPPPGWKAPLTEHGFCDATTDLGIIRAWWDRWPDANVGIATGVPGPDVLDVDVKPDGDGFAALGKLKRAGLLTGAAALVRTRSGGLHGRHRSRHHKRALTYGRSVVAPILPELQDLARPGWSFSGAGAG